MDVIQHCINQALAVVAAVWSFADAPRSVNNLPRCKGGFQVADDKPCQADRRQEGSPATTGDWRRLLQQERQRAGVRDFEAGAVVDGAAKAGKAPLGFPAGPRALPPFPQARFASRGELARRALARSGTGLGEIARLYYSRGLVPPHMKMQSGQLMEQVQQRSCEPLLKKVLTLSEGQNSSCIADWIRLARELRGCRGCGDTSGQMHSSIGSGFRCARFHTTQAWRWAGPAAARFRLRQQTRWKLPLSLRRTQKIGCQFCFVGKPTPPQANVKPKKTKIYLHPDLQSFMIPAS